MSEGACVERRRWAFTGVGYRTLGDAWLAEMGAAVVRERRRAAREALASDAAAGSTAKEPSRAAGGNR